MKVKSFIEVIMPPRCFEILEALICFFFIYHFLCAQPIYQILLKAVEIILPSEKRFIHTVIFIAKIKNMDEFVNLHIDMNDFENIVANHLSSQRTDSENILSQYEVSLRGYREHMSIIRNKLSGLKEKNIDMQRYYSKTAVKNESIRNHTSDLNLKKEQLKSKKNEFQEELSRLRTLVKRREIQCEHYKQQIEKQQSRNNPELKLYQRLLGLTISQDKAETLTFQFEGLSSQNVHKKCWIKIDISLLEHRYHILEIFPPLDDTKKLTLLHALNIEHNLPKFLITCRLFLLDQSLKNTVNVEKR